MENGTADDLMRACNLLSGSLFSNTSAIQMQAFARFSHGFRLFHKYFCIFMCAFAVFTNIINVIVLTQPRMRNSVNVTLTGIALCDFTTMLSYLIFSSLFYYYFIPPPPAYPYWSMLFLEAHMYLTVVTHSASLWFAVVVAWIRHVILKNRDSSNGLMWLKPRRAVIAMIYVSGVTMVLCAPAVLCYQISYIPSFTFNFTRYGDGYTVDISMLATAHHCALLRFTLWTQGVCFKLIPSLLLVIYIVLLVKSLKKAQERTQRLLGRRREGSDRTTLLLVSVVTVSLITEIPQSAVAILYGIYPYETMHVVYLHLGDLLDFLGLANSSINFILYILMSSKYRETCCAMLFPKAVYYHIYGEYPRCVSRAEPSFMPAAAFSTQQSGPDTVSCHSALRSNDCLSQASSVSIRRKTMEYIRVLARNRSASTFGQAPHVIVTLADVGDVPNSQNPLLPRKVSLGKRVSWNHSVLIQKDQDSSGESFDCE